MKRKAPPMLSEAGQQTINQYRQMLRQLEDLSSVTIRNYLYAIQAQIADISPHDLRLRFSYRMAEVVLLHRLTQIMGYDSLDTTMLYIHGTKQDLQQDVEKIAWI